MNRKLMVWTFGMVLGALANAVPVLPADPFRIPVRALELSSHSTVEEALKELLQRIGYELDLSQPRLAKEIAAQPLPQWMVRDEILTLRVVIEDMLGPDTILLVDPEKRTLSFDMPDSLFGETQEGEELANCLKIVAMNGLMQDQPAEPARHRGSGPAWRLIPASTALSGEVMIDDVVVELDAPLAREGTREAGNYLVRLEEGSLRANLIRVLGDFGYTLGQWDFGSAEEDIDWHILKRYTYSRPRDLSVVLRAIGKSYRLRAVINELDSTVDFRAAPAIAGGEQP